MAKRVSLIKLDQERKILNLLTINPYSIDGVAQATGLNYYTVRNVVSDLFSRGILTIHSTVDRHRYYTYDAHNNNAHDFIPRVTDLLNKRSFKIIDLLENIGQENEGAATKATAKLTNYVTQLMSAANSASHGQTVSQQLESIRIKMQKDYLYIQNSAGFFDQILKEPRFWDERYLAEMTKDEAFNYQAVQEAQDHYDSADG